MGNREVIFWSVLLATVTIPSTYYLLRQPTRTKLQHLTGNDDEEQDHPLLRDHSLVRSYTTSITTYTSIRTFYRAHAHKAKLPELAELPLLVFIHGLGGSLPQFGPLLGSLINVAPCFGLELAGHGRSAFAPTDYPAYAFEANVELWKTALEDVCDRHGHKSVILIGHSMGCPIAATLATSPDLKPDVVGIVAICPKGSPPNQSQTKAIKRFLSLPDWALDTFRWVDRRGQEESPSVKRFVGEGASTELKKLQLKFNEQFKTPVWKRAAIGILPHTDSSGRSHGGMPGRETWSKIRTPLLLVAGEADIVTKPTEVSDIVAFLQSNPQPSGPLPQDPKPQIPIPEPPVAPTNTTSPSPIPAEGVLTEKRTHHNLLVKTAVLPSPAGHALLYSPQTSRTLAGLIEDFLSTHIDPHLSQTWQLQHLTTSGKWDVKNLAKWERTLSVSGPIPAPPKTTTQTANSTENATTNTTNIFRALKTLRQVDPHHTPLVFVETWKNEIFAVVDISHDLPIYDTKSLQTGGWMEYHKYPTVSKSPPTPDEVTGFIALIDRLRDEEAEKISLRSSSSSSSSAANLPSSTTTANNPATAPLRAVAIHCHYGFNRTGFFIVCYLIEKLKMDVEDALREFAVAKPPGIKHEHFVDVLFVRYTVGIRRGRTWKLE